jgi:hypothetical protein
LAIRDDHTLWDFTIDTNGVQVGTQAIFEKCFSSGTANFAIAQDSTLWGWTSYIYGNSNGELGIGNTNPQPNIIQLNYSKWISVSSSYGSTSGIKADGTIWFWGHDILYPIQIGSDNDWQNVKTNWNTVFALKNDGTIWKRNVNPISSPFIQIGADSDWSSIWSGWSAPFGIKNNGTLWYNIWNSNGGQVGNDTIWESISNLTGYKYGIKTDGTLWFWDWNVNPLLVPPVQITTFSNYSQISQHMDYDNTNGTGVSAYAIHDSNQLWIEKYNMNATCPNLGITTIKTTSTILISVVPNPVQDQFTIHGLDNLENVETLELKDANGKVVKELDPKTTEFSISELNAGIYFLEISAGNIHEMIKLVKE